MTLHVGNSAEPPRGPTPERMTELWNELKDWPPEHAMNFALCLANLSMVNLGTGAVDAGVYDGVRDADVYIVAAAGPMEPELRWAVRQMLKDRECASFPVKLGDRPTPMSGDDAGGEPS